MRTTEIISTKKGKNEHVAIMGHIESTHDL